MTSSRLTLVDGTLELLTAAITDAGALQVLLGASLVEGWAGFPEALPALRATYANAPSRIVWGTLFFVESKASKLVGFGGFKGPPQSDGVVEIGYCIAPSCRGQGLATEAVAQMLSRAFANTAVTAVDAHTLGEVNPSTRVLEKSGFQKVAEYHDPDAGPVWQWRLKRPRLVPG